MLIRMSTLAPGLLLKPLPKKIYQHATEGASARVNPCAHSRDVSTYMTMLAIF